MIKEESVKTGRLYKHYKGGLYRVVGTVTAEWDLKELVIYKDSQGKIWARDLEEFTGLTIDENAKVAEGFVKFTKRFTEVEEQCQQCGDDIEPGYTGYAEMLCEICYSQDTWREDEEE